MEANQVLDFLQKQKQAGLSQEIDVQFYSPDNKPLFSGTIFAIMAAHDAMPITIMVRQREE